MFLQPLDDLYYRKVDRAHFHRYAMEGAAGDYVDVIASTFHVQGGVTFRVFKETERLGPWWCQTWGPAATYTWSVSGNTLKLAPSGGHDACAIRGFIWSGTWTRAG